ncbi:hypothetical protein [Paraliomyxa miuraensis]|uniref:hypothetical protein n=1 Tax=Paraliomyxa miuraensis TaxID=376150 RepID=UPI002252FC14|nr:hypothetical protein [Paraliomyxa miuraensis]MCX4246212.1 hypothetical protein [Paraliomyxa miuraensis]
MAHHHLFAILTSLSALLACNARPLDPLPCSGEGQTIEDGEELESLDGCVTYVCDDGTLAVAEDRRLTIAGDLELASQQAVDEQSCLGVVEGTLRISGTAAELTPLASLHRIGGGLELVATEAETLAGLEGLTEIGGNIDIVDNARLTTLSFRPSMSAFGDIAIQNNDALVSLAGAEFIGQCTACVGLSDQPDELANPSVEAEPARFGGDQAPEGGTFFGNILVADNDVLTDVYAISNLHFAYGSFRFRSNAVLTSLTGLQLMQVSEDLEISDHASMSTLEAETFAAGVVVGGVTTICGNLEGEACP